MSGYPRRLNCKLPSRLPPAQNTRGERQNMRKILILISGSPCVGKTAAGVRLSERYDNSAYLDGDWCWCVHPFSMADKRLRNGDKNMSFILSNYLDSDFEYVFFTSVVLTDTRIRAGILNGITAKGYSLICFTLTCSEETLKKRHDKRGDKGETNYHWLHLTPCPGDIVIDTDNKSVREVVREMKQHIDALKGGS